MMNENIDVALKSYDYVKHGLESKGFDLTEEQLQKLTLYMGGILDWNQKVNLTAVTEPKEFVEKHYVDSLFATEVAEYMDAERILDLGTGGGFPGVPLAIAGEEKSFILADSLAKRLKIIDALVSQIGITNVETVHGRFEDLGRSKELRESFDAVVSRAVAEMAVLAEYALPFLCIGGSLIAYKTGGEKLQEELRAAETAIKILGGELSRIKAAEGDHVLVIINKVTKTPKEYPRRPGTPKRNPL